MVTALLISPIKAWLACAGAKLKQKKALVVPAAEALPVHEDEELAAQSSTAPAGHVAPAGTLRRRLDAGDLQEHLRHDPLRLHKVCCMCSGTLRIHAACID